MALKEGFQNCHIEIKILQIYNSPSTLYGVGKHLKIELPNHHWIHENVDKDGGQMKALVIFLSTARKFQYLIRSE